MQKKQLLCKKTLSAVLSVLMFISIMPMSGIVPQAHAYSWGSNWRYKTSENGAWIYPQNDALDYYNGTGYYWADFYGNDASVYYDMGKWHPGCLVKSGSTLIITNSSSTVSNVTMTSRNGDKNLFAVAGGTLIIGEGITLDNGEGCSAVAMEDGTYGKVYVAGNVIKYNDTQGIWTDTTPQYYYRLGRYNEYYNNGKLTITDCYPLSVSAGTGVSSVSAPAGIFGGREFETAVGRGKKYYYANTTYTVNCSVAGGYHFSSWTGSATSYSQSYSFSFSGYDSRSLTASAAAHTSNGYWMNDWADGHYTYCTGCGTWLTSDSHHSNGSWTAADGNTHYTYCKDCGRWLSSGSHTFSWKNNGNGTHSYYCTLCGYVASTAAHSGGAATCTAQPVCTTCGASYGSANGHSFTVLQSDANNHWYKCSACSAVNGTAAHTGGTATCTAQAKCSVCGTSYGSVSEHVSNGTWMTDDETCHYTYCTACGTRLTSGNHRLNGSWVSVDGSTHRMYCSDCGRTMNTGSHTMAYKNNGDGTHSNYCRDCRYVASTAAHSGGTATCTEDAVCSSCGAVYDEKLGHSFTKYVYDNNATCLADGTKTAKCDRCTVTDTVTTADTKLSHSYTGDVKDNENGTHSFKCVNGCGEYGTAVSCEYEREITKAATCTGNGTTKYTCKTCGYYYTADDITAPGHLWNNGEVTSAPSCTGKGVKTYTCTRTGCGETKTEDIDATGHFLTKTEAKEATCIATGNNEYWTCSVCEKVYKDSGAVTQTSVEAETLAVDSANHMGDTFTKDVNIVKATCASKGGYDTEYYCKDCEVYLFTMPHETKADPDNHTGETYTKDENVVNATCTAKGGYDLVTYCKGCDKKLGSETKELAVNPDNHTGETYTKDENIVAATCAAKGGYDLVTYCKGCDKKLGSEAKELAVNPDNHTGETYTKDENVVAATCAAKGGYDLVTYCKGCDKKLGSEAKELAVNPDNHTGETYTKDENVVAATCAAKGGYDLVTYCKGCDKKLGSEAKDLEIDADNHTGETYTQNENVTNANCVTEGEYDVVTYCSDCKAKLGSEHIEGALDPSKHTGETYTKDENVVAATCTAKGGYDLVTYCKGCDKKLGSEAKELAANPDNHTGETYTKDENVVAATCAAKGGYDLVTYCKGCDKKLGSEAKELAVNPDNHTGETYTKDENVVAATCTAKGGYDFVTYCKGCDKKLGSEAKELEIDPDAHTGVNHTENYAEATCTAAGYTGDTVCECGEIIEKGKETAIKEHVIVLAGQTAPSCTKEGKNVYKCENCDYSYNTGIPATGHTNGAAARENIVYTENGKVKEYDSVVRCTVCGEAISSIHMIPDYECPACNMQGIAEQLGVNTVIGKLVTFCHKILHAIFKLFDTVIYG